MTQPSKIQTAQDLDIFYSVKDPWGYSSNPDDIIRREYLLTTLPKVSYDRVLDIGCGNGFLTYHLPGEFILGCDLSAKAIAWAQQQTISIPNKKIRFMEASIFDLLDKPQLGTFDLVVLTGVLYSQYIGKSTALIHEVIDNLLKTSGILVSCHIAEWHFCTFPYPLIDKIVYPYRQYTRQLEVYKK